MAKRRLTTILALDVVGFSRMMESAPSDLLAALNVIFRRLVRPSVARHEGRIVKLVGDGAIIEFSSPFAAVACAGDIKSALGQGSVDYSFPLPIILRAGVHVGDLIVEGADLFGSGVNVAVRLQEAAPPGGVWLSRMVADLAGADLAGSLRGEGVHSFAGIDRPLEVLSLDLVAPEPLRQRRAIAETQTIRFCTTADGVRLAWASVGGGPVVVKAPNWISHLEFDWESPGAGHVIGSLAAEFRIVRFDARGNGLSDWNPPEIAFDRFVDDLERVFDAAGVERAPILAFSQGCAVAAAFAARAPERVAAIAMCGGFPQGRARRRSEEERRRAAAMREMMRTAWHDERPSLRDLMAEIITPLASEEQRRRYADLMKHMITPENMARYRAALDDIDVTGLLPSVTAPCLVLHATGDRMHGVDQGRLFAAGLPNSRFLTFESPNHVPTGNDPAWAAAARELRDFLARHATRCDPASST